MQLTQLQLQHSVAEKFTSIWVVASLRDSKQNCLHINTRIQEYHYLKLSPILFFVAMFFNVFIYHRLKKKFVTIEKLKKVPHQRCHQHFSDSSGCREMSENVGRFTGGVTDISRATCFWYFPTYPDISWHFLTFPDISWHLPTVGNRWENVGDISEGGPLRWPMIQGIMYKDYKLEIKNINLNKYYKCSKKKKYSYKERRN